MAGNGKAEKPSAQVKRSNPLSFLGKQGSKWFRCVNCPPCTEELQPNYRGRVANSKQQQQLVSRTEKRLARKDAIAATEDEQTRTSESLQATIIHAQENVNDPHARIP